MKIETNNKPLSLKEITDFESRMSVQLPEKFKRFLLKWNGGSPEPSLFNISSEQGTSVLNMFNGIGDMYDNLEKVIDIYEFRLPDGFIPIGDDPAGNIICLGINSPYNEKIYYWDHEQESDNPNEMSNMYYLARDIEEFLESLYDDTEQ